MGVRVVFPDMGKDPSVQLIEKTITENGTYDAITDGANGYSKVNVNVEGGGSSDFSTAEVEVINTTADLVSVSAVCIRDTAIEPFGTIMADSDRLRSDGIYPRTATASDHTYTVPLYKGVCRWRITAVDAVVAVTGDISYDNGNIFITGDGTITIS